MMDDPLEPSLDPSLLNIIEQKSLKWIFVGGKGGVGKTTTSCSLGYLLSQHRKNVLIISTDPAHNLSDAFNQQITKVPTQINGTTNLFAMEIDSTVELETGDVLDSSSHSFISELASSVPGIDEAMSFSELMKQVQSMNFEVIVFDTAPTGHTLRLLSFPAILEKGFGMLGTLKNKFSGVLTQVQSMLQAQGTEEKLIAKFEETKKIIEAVIKQFKNPDLTTFVCVCIPEFLSVYETERLIQTLTKFEIDTKNLVVNQVLFPEPGRACKKCSARVKMQSKYLNDINSLYVPLGFHIVCMPLLDEEVRSLPALKNFAKMLASKMPNPLNEAPTHLSASQVDPVAEPIKPKKKKSGEVQKISRSQRPLTCSLFLWKIRNLVRCLTV